MIAVCFVLIATIGLLFRPGYTREINSSGYVLLTPGYEKNKVDSLRSVNPGIGTLALPGLDPLDNTRVLTSYQDLADLDYEILFIVGEGLPSFALDLMDTKKFQFIGTPVPAGIVELDVEKVNMVNQLNRVSGFVNSPGKAMVRLVGPGGKEDSVFFKNRGVSPFSLAFNPKQPGLYLYTMEYIDHNGVQSGQIPVTVAEEQKLNILFLQKFPSFEVRQLKNFLAENGHRLALRYQVSKDNYRVEFANVSSMRTSPLTTSVLQEFDLVVVDGDGLEALPTSEKNTLEQSIRDGLGLILLSDKAIENDKLHQRFVPIEMKRTLKDSVYLKLSAKPYMLPVLPLQVVGNSSVYIVTRKGERIFSAYSYNGFGKTGLQLLRETYRIALEGNVDDYAELWSPLIEKVARKKDDLVKVKLHNAFPVYQDEPFSLEVIDVGEFRTVMNDQEPIAVMEHVAVDNLWLGKTWAGNPGWHDISIDSTTVPYFVSDQSTWQTLRLSNQRKQNELVAIHKSESSPPDVFYQQKQIPTVIFYMLFLFGAGFLWLAPKI